ncbi:MAG: RNA-directed DNA polymerase [Saprospiraceae bacterium]|nr:RNA-directed DNA polymerase [Saprospiraceae bacterium]MCB9356928.1 RNA-directed DNA polymerase [Lewinellaceae bacterium]
MDNSIAALAGLRKAFFAMRTAGDLAELLAVSPAHLVAVAFRPWYHIFELPKKDGTMRLIEDPDDRLQPLQDGLNDYLQAVYWHQRSPAAYGFLVIPTGDPEPRHIETNARKHIGKPWLLNCDLEDFFHQITAGRVHKLFADAPFGFDEEVCDLLVRLTTFRGRCPMGAPTSPVLSNLVFSATDADLTDLARRRGWTYTRYADDLSFSSYDPLDWDDYTHIQRAVIRHDYEFNPEKAALFGPDDPKIVTGLLLGTQDVEVPPDFFPQLTDDIHQLAGAMRVQFRVNPRGSRTTARFRRSVEGKLRFAERIMGRKHPGVAKLWKDYRNAVKPPAKHIQRSWFDFEYW